MKKLTGVISIIRVIIKYSAYVIALVEVLEFAVKTFEKVETNTTETNDN